MSPKYVIPAFPGRVLSTPSRPSRKLNRPRIWPGTQPGECDSWWTVFVFATVCCLVCATSGCGSGLDGNLSASTSNLSFGSVTINSAATEVLTLTSTGTAPVIVNSASITGAGFSILGGSFPLTLNPMQTVTLPVQFHPTTAGAATGQITINSNSAADGTAVVALSGMGTTAAAPPPAGPQLSISTSNLGFGNVMVNISTAQPLTLTSTGTSPVTINSASIAGTGFTIVGGSLPVTLNPSQAVTLQIQFLPTSVGADAGQLTISSDSAAGGTAVVGLSGVGTTTATPPPAGSQLSVSTLNLGFGNVMVNTSAEQQVTLTSTGSSPVMINSASITGVGFTIVAGSFPVTLNPSQSVTLQVQFLPTSTGVVAGQLTINSNSINGSMAIVALNATAVIANPQLTLSTASLSFGSVAVDTSATQSVTLTSTGTSAVTVNSASISGEGLSILGGSFPLTLNPTQTATLQIQFLPTSAGTVAGQLTISSNSTNGNMSTVTVSGTGAVGAHSVDLSWDAPSSSTDPVVGYNIYRSISSSGPFLLMNSSPDTQTTYVDNTVVSGTTYNYYAESVDASGTESVPSNEISVTIP